MAFDDTCIYVYIHVFRYKYVKYKCACEKTTEITQVLTTTPRSNQKSALPALAASRQRPAGDPATPLRPKCDPQAPQKQPRSSHENALAALAALRQRPRATLTSPCGPKTTPKQPRSDPGAGSSAPGGPQPPMFSRCEYEDEHAQCKCESTTK